MVKGPSWADKMLMTEDQWQKEVESEREKWGRTEKTEELTDVPTKTKCLGGQKITPERAGS